VVAQWLFRFSFFKESSDMIDSALDQVLRAQQECHHDQGGTDLEGGADAAGAAGADATEVDEMIVVDMTDVTEGTGY
jgi:hypothetical protein